jgi:hypothetical protein
VKLEWTPRRCSGCGRALEVDFLYCPQCGRPVEELADFQNMLDGSFARLAAVEASHSARRLEDLDERLRDLEAELEDLVTHAEEARTTRR